MASKSVTWMRFPGDSSIVVGVSRGKGFYKVQFDCSCRSSRRIRDLTHEKVLEVFVRPFARFENALGKVDAARVLFQTKNQGSRRRRAIHAVDVS